MTALLRVLTGLLDRIRGGFPHGRAAWIAHLATSTACAIMAWLPTEAWQAAVFGLAWGEVAWRQDNGWRGHWLRAICAVRGRRWR